MEDFKREIIKDLHFDPFEPKLNNRFIVYVESKDFKIDSYVIHTIDLPKAELGLSGDFFWRGIDMILYDPIVPSSSQAIYDIVKNGKASLGKVTIKSLGPVGDVVEVWELTNVKITSVEFGRRDWKSLDPAMITLRLHYDDAKLVF